MLPDKLANAPLVEAILEVRWELIPQGPGLAYDPNYKLLVGRLYDRLSGEYPVHEPLQAASMPDEMLGHVVQHRFRSGKNEWPLVQVGPGVVTLNDTSGYDWPDFERRGQTLLSQLFAAYPNTGQPLSIVSLDLKYIDAIAFDYAQKDVLEFMSANLEISMVFPEKFFRSSPIASYPSGMNVVFSFPITSPVGVINLRFGTGKHQGEAALIWETQIHSENDQIAEMPGYFGGWFAQAHELTHNMFFKLIEGPLRERFQ